MARGPTEPTVAATVGAIRQIVIAIGRVEPVTEVTVGNKIPGGIKAELVKEGDRVKIGQPTIRFDDAELAAQVRMPPPMASISSAPPSSTIPSPRPCIRCSSPWASPSPAYSLHERT